MLQAPVDVQAATGVGLLNHPLLHCAVQRVPTAAGTGQLEKAPLAGLVGFAVQVTASAGDTVANQPLMRDNDTPCAAQATETHLCLKLSSTPQIALQKIHTALRKGPDHPWQRQPVIP